MTQRPESSQARRDPHRAERTYAAVRAAIVGYGVLGLGFLQSGLAPAEAPRALGGFASSQGLVLTGLALQALLIVARALLRRYAADEDTVRRAMPIAGLLADAVTVLLFALGTFGALAPSIREL